MIESESEKLEKRERTKQGWKVKINSDIKVNFLS